MNVIPDTTPGGMFPAAPEPEVFTLMWVVDELTVIVAAILKLPFAPELTPAPPLFFCAFCVTE